MKTKEFFDHAGTGAAGFGGKGIVRAFVRFVTVSDFSRLNFSSNRNILLEHDNTCHPDSEGNITEHSASH